MKCREINPGNAFSSLVNASLSMASMKCREINPGNS